MAIGRLKSEANALGAADVVGVKTYVAELGSGLVEFLAIGTAMALVRGRGNPETGELERPPTGRSAVMIGIGAVAELWGLASLIKG